MLLIYEGILTPNQTGRVGIIPVGYADGLRRIPKNINTVLVDGRERKILGHVCRGSSSNRTENRFKPLLAYQ